METRYVVLLIVLSAATLLQILSSIIQQITVHMAVRSQAEAQASHNKLAENLAIEALDRLLAVANRPAYWDLQNAKKPKSEPEAKERIREI